MYPVLFSIGPLSITSFGVSLILSLVLAVFVIWRISMLFQQDEERIIDVALLSFAGALLGARVYYIFSHPDSFSSITQMALFFKYPGFSFWGGVIGGILLYFLSIKLFKLNFWQIADYMILGILAGLSLGSLGCLLSTCQYGLPSNLPITVTQIGIIDKRFPLQVFEAFFFALSFVFLWSKALKFHFNGQIASLGLILIGLVKIFLEPLRGDRQLLFSQISAGLFFGAACLVSGIIVFYKQGKRSFKNDLAKTLSVIKNPNYRHYAISRFKIKCYNLWAKSKQALNRKRRKFFTKLNVKSTPPKF